MRFLTLVPFMAGLALGTWTSEYGPCDYNGNLNCREIMDNTACFLNPRTPEGIFKCISGGASGVCACYGCLGYKPITDLIKSTNACEGVPTDPPAWEDWADQE
ncbi:hypothetical protein V8F20_007131 [Naviculisporaceae sp. PSN 640]